MEIHELNTFSGTPGANDYLATDNGEDTSKIAITSITGPLNDRIDNIIAGPAPSEQEIIDARLGGNGTTYPSLGGAIRTQFTDLKNQIDNAQDSLDKDTISTHDRLVFVQGGIRTSNGSDSASDTRIRTAKYIATDRYKYIEADESYKYMIFVYTEDNYGSFQGVYDGRSIGTTGVWLTGRTYLNFDQSFFRMVLAEENDATIDDASATHATFVSYGQVKTDVAELVSPHPVNVSYSNNQEINPATGGNRDAANYATSDYIYSPYSKINVSMPSGIKYRLYEYERAEYTSYTAVATNWLSGSKSIDTKPGRYYRIVMYKTDGTAIDLEDIYNSGSVSVYKIADSSYLLNGFGLDINEEFSWSYGSIKTEDGQSTTLNADKRCRTKLSLINPTHTVRIPINYVLTLYLYENNTTDSYIESVSYVGTNECVSLRDAFEAHPTAKFIRLVARYSYNAVIDNVRDFVSAISLYGAKITVHDAPETQGVINVVKRARQLTDIVYNPVADLPAQEDKYQSDNYKILAGTECIGMKYSSVRIEQLYVPQAVSFETFMTAIANPNSYLYTKQSTVPNSKTYYGAVCSTFVAYCYGIDDVIPTTISFSRYPGFTELPEYMQNAGSMKIGHMLNNAGSHIAIVTDIIRDFNGRIQLVEMSDAWHPFMRRRMLTPAQIQTGYFDIGFKLYRYDYIDAVPYIATPWVSVDDEPTVTPTVNNYLSPRRGNEANWRSSEAVEIDVLNRGEYTHYVLVNRSTSEVVAKERLNGSPIILNNLGVGRYRMHLTDETNDSANVRFNIMDTTETYQTIEDGVIRVSYQTSLGTPSAILFCNNNPSCYDYRAVRYFYVLTEEQIRDGYAVVNKPPIEDLEYQDEEYEAPNGVWEMRVQYKTEYGLYTSDGAQVNVYV